MTAVKGLIVFFWLTTTVSSIVVVEYQAPSIGGSSSNLEVVKHCRVGILSGTGVVLWSRIREVDPLRVNFWIGSSGVTLTFGVL